MDRGSVTTRLLQLVDRIATAEKEASDARYELSSVKSTIAVRKGEIVLGFNPKEVRNEDQREAIIQTKLRSEFEKLHAAQRKYDYAKLKVYRLKAEYDVLLGVLWSEVPAMSNPLYRRAE